MSTYKEGFEAGLNRAIEIVSKRFEVIDDKYIGEAFYADELTILRDDIISDIEVEPLPDVVDN